MGASQQMTTVEELEKKRRKIIERQIGLRNKYDRMPDGDPDKRATLDMLIDLTVEKESIEEEICERFE